MRYEATQKKKKSKSDDKSHADDKKKTGKNNRSNRNKRSNKYIKEVVAKQAAELEAKFEQKFSSMSSVSSKYSSQHCDGASFISSVQTRERRIYAINRSNGTNVGKSAALEMDSHAYTSILFFCA